MGSCGLIILPMIMLLTIIFMNNNKNEIIGGVDCYPIQAPNLTNCVLATDQSVLGPFLNLTFNCCVKVPNTSHSLDFSWDLYAPIHTRVRVPAHRANPHRVVQYKHAYELMRALPDDDPRSWTGQANLHCSFCNGALKQVGVNASGNVTMQIHFSWLFLPWHRWYLFFHERILANLVQDPSFSLVFWNWDDQIDGGNQFPHMFAQNGTSLFDNFRNIDNINNASALVQLVPLSNVSDRDALITQNLNSLHTSIVSATTPELFFGGAYRVGTDLSGDNVLNAPLGGSIENVQHDAVHHWTGDPTQPLAEDMGTFSTAARDPIFFTHHANIDRLWTVWETLPGGDRHPLDDIDFLDAEFEFFDENANLVKVKARDALDNRKLGIKYAKVKSDKLWIDFSASVTSNRSTIEYAKQQYGVVEISDGSKPNASDILLGEKLVVLVKRPNEVLVNGSKSEVLIVQGIDINRDTFVQLMVFVNLPDVDHHTSASCAEFVGIFNVVPTSASQQRIFVNAKFQIGDSLQRIGLDHDDYIVVTILVKPSDVNATIKGMTIVYE